MSFLLGTWAKFIVFPCFWWISLTWLPLRGTMTVSCLNTLLAPNFQLISWPPLEERTRNLALSCGPAEILAAYEDFYSLSELTANFDDGDFLFSDDQNSPLWDYLSHPLARIWQERKVKPPPEDSSHWKSILDERIGEYDTCKFDLPPYILPSISHHGF